MENKDEVEPPCAGLYSWVAIQNLKGILKEGFPDGSYLVPLPGVDKGRGFCKGLVGMRDIDGGRPEPGGRTRLEVGWKGESQQRPGDIGKGGTYIGTVPKPIAGAAGGLWNYKCRGTQDPGGKI